MRLINLRIAWRNLGRSRRRSLLAVSAIALAQLIVVFVNGMMAGSFDDMLRTITGPLVGHVQIHHADWPDERAADLYVDGLAKLRGKLAGLKEVAAVSPRVYTAVLSARGAKTDRPADAEPAMIVGVDVAAESQDDGILADVAPQQRPGAGGVVVGKVLARRLGIGPGESIALIGQDADGFPVSDLFEVRAVIRSNVDVISRLGIVMALPDAQDLLVLPDKAHDILLRSDDPRGADDLARSVSALLGEGQAEVVTWREAVPQLAGIIEMKGWMDVFFVGILFVAAAAGIANTMMMSTFDRLHEFGMLLALGTRPRRLVWMIVLEAVVLGLLGVAIGSALGAAAVGITGYTGINYAALTSSDAPDAAIAGLNISFIIYPKFEFRNVMIGAIAVVVTAVLASLWPAALAARLQPVEAMRS